MKKWTKVHFELITTVVSRLDNERIREWLAEQFISELRDTNEQFDANKFRKGCAVRTKEVSDTKTAQVTYDKAQM
jgi:hypothetical protein